jgi:SNF2 family DNA or RNA helicase
MWCQNYCVYGGYGNYEIVGYKNIQELKHLLQPNMLRRKKENVLDLPPKIHHTEYVENTDYQAHLYRRVKEDVKLAMKESPRFNIMVQMLSLMKTALRTVCTS